MLANPEAQRKAQEEIDKVIPAGHLPDFSDYDSLPYVAAIVKEMIRWQTVAPIGEDMKPVAELVLVVYIARGHAGIPHVVHEEDAYRGYRIPAGSMIIINLWYDVFPICCFVWAFGSQFEFIQGNVTRRGAYIAMIVISVTKTTNQTVYPEPFSFKPERFLTPDGTALDPTVQDPAQAFFGFGKRYIKKRCSKNTMRIDLKYSQNLPRKTHGHVVYMEVSVFLAMMEARRK